METLEGPPPDGPLGPPLGLLGPLDPPEFPKEREGLEGSVVFLKEDREVGGSAEGGRAGLEAVNVDCE